MYCDNFLGQEREGIRGKSAERDIAEHGNTKFAPREFEKVNYFNGALFSLPCLIGFYIVAVVF